MPQSTTPSRFWIVVLTLVGVLHAGAFVRGEDGAVSFDFRQPGGERGWEATHDVALTPSGLGLSVQITGADPYLTGPLFQTPPVGRAIVRMRLNSDTGGGGQLFFYTDGPSEEHSVKFSAPAGVMTEVFVPLPELGPQTRFRLDPPGTSGSCLIESIRVVSGLATEWPKWQAASLATDDKIISLGSDAFQLRHSKSRFGVFELFVEGRLMGTSGVLPQVAVEHQGRVEWLKVTGDQVEWVSDENSLYTSGTARLPGGGTLLLQQMFRLPRVGELNSAGAIPVEATLTASERCSLVYAPLLLVFPGQGAFGDQKGQALFPGVEYLENEPSSSEADVDAARALRRVPAAHKITFPLMAVQADGRYLGLIWEPQADVAALFDSPDRRFGTKSHVLGLIAPGATDGRREDGQELPRLATVIEPDHPIHVTARLIAGQGDSVVPAVQQYVEWKGVPESPPEPTSAEFAHLLSPGWLDSPLRDGPKFRHAVAGEAFQAQPAADAIWMMQQLAAVLDRDLKQESVDEAIRLRQAAKESLAALPPGLLHHAAVGHIRSPNATLLLGDPLEGMQQARNVAIGQLALLGPEGKLEYVRDPNRPDFARTHWSKEANGLAAPVVARALEEAAFSGDQALIDQALAQLRMFDKYKNTVPRGAQTWEIPLHTPDILASAHLVKAYTLGYELTRDAKFLEQAKYWAWTGVPFVYLEPQFPVSESQIGLYATIPVLGATHWDSVLWIGLPVQWCGLVYADALQRLSRYDEAGPWQKIADGIVLSGIEQTYPPHDPHCGLLPDSYNLIGQSRNPADINPGTLQIPAVRTLIGWESYDMRKVLQSGWTIHAPAAVSLNEISPTRVNFMVNAWTKDSYSVVVHGLKTRPRCEAQKHPVEFDDEFSETEANENPIHKDDPWDKLIEDRFNPATGTLILKLSGPVDVTIDTTMIPETK